jgi:23S rRNA pseudouridine1911/1915/1917 synthase
VSALDVLFVDNHLLVVDKPAGLPSVPDASGDESLFERAKAWLKVEFERPGDVFLGIVQRLDRPVSGVLCFARTSKAAARLTKAFGAKDAHKTYLAIGAGALPAGSPDHGELEEWLVKDHDKNRVTSFREEPRAGVGAKLAITRWRRLEERVVRGARETLFAFEPVTGRSHQLRLAARALGTPLLGDLRYAPGSEPLADRSIALHARRLAFVHPVRKQPVAFEAEPPERAWWRGWAESLPRA